MQYMCNVKWTVYQICIFSLYLSPPAFLLKPQPASWKTSFSPFHLTSLSSSVPCVCLWVHRDRHRRIYLCDPSAVLCPFFCTTTSAAANPLYAHARVVRLKNNSKGKQMLGHLDVCVLSDECPHTQLCTNTHTHVQTSVTERKSTSPSGGQRWDLNSGKNIFGSEWRELNTFWIE